ncbi:hypothetical protein GDO78_017275 [Eleutherodactylus coqui]|uniref:Uncharacterized protein n=1 Tax=Eleutherodactylus coqui TaxID=57060 RepID=A0A8J6BQZ6_ELECQ|nr:hypothetical protein GDO78_017275 [Eleutherodactylus coqui]
MLIKAAASFGLENGSDEIKSYESGRNISRSEAVWRIPAFPMHEKFPTLCSSCCAFGQRIYFDPNDNNNLLQKINSSSKTTLLAFLQLCKT